MVWCGVVAGPVLVLVLLWQGLWRGDYASGRDPISSLGLGPAGWVQILAFVVVGLLVVIFGLGVRRLRERDPALGATGLLLVVVGAGLVGVGVFVVDPVAWHGRLHDISTGVAINAALLAVVVHGVTRWRAGRRGRAVHGAATAVACAALGWPADPDTIALRHTVIVLVLAIWLTTTAAGLLRDRRGGRDPAAVV